MLATFSVSSRYFASLIRSISSRAPRWNEIGVQGTGVLKTCSSSSGRAGFCRARKAEEAKDLVAIDERDPGKCLYSRALRNFSLGGGFFRRFLKR